MRPARTLPARQGGLSLAEVLAATVLLAMTVIPASEALRTALRAAESSEEQTVHEYRMRGKLEEVLAEPFAMLAANAAGPATASVYSDPPGSSVRRLVFIAPYDADNADSDGDPFTGGEPGLLWIEVRLEGRAAAVQTLKADK